MWFFPSCFLTKVTCAARRVCPPFRIRNDLITASIFTLSFPYPPAVRKCLRLRETRAWFLPPALTEPPPLTAAPSPLRTCRSHGPAFTQSAVFYRPRRASDSIHVLMNAATIRLTSQGPPGDFAGFITLESIWKSTAPTASPIALRPSVPHPAFY